MDCTQAIPTHSWMRKRWMVGVSCLYFRGPVRIVEHEAAQRTDQTGPLLGSIRGLVCLRNPWGRSEWLGPWSDLGDEWQAHPKVDEACKRLSQERPFTFESGGFRTWHVLKTDRCAALAAFQVHRGPWPILAVRLYQIRQASQSSFVDASSDLPWKFPLPLLFPCSIGGG